MGSIQSVRSIGKQLVENCLKLDLAWLMRMAPIRDGCAASGELKWSLDGQPIASATFKLEFHGIENTHLFLCHCQIGPDGRREKAKQIISLTPMTQHFGGWRWWMVCPVTGDRVRTLLLPIGGDRFACRKAWDLAYRVERLGRFDRPFERLFRAQRKLGNAQGLGMELRRPKGMWRRTYARHLEHFEALDIGCAERIGELIESA